VDWQRFRGKNHTKRMCILLTAFGTDHWHERLELVLMLLSYHQFGAWMVVFRCLVSHDDPYGTEFKICDTRQKHLITKHLRYILSSLLRQPGLPRPLCYKYPGSRFPSSPVNLLTWPTKTHRPDHSLGYAGSRRESQ
jgi:hypothetical protein